MRNITVAAIQMQCSKIVEENIDKAEKMVREAASKGAQVILLPELFEREYFCQQRRYDFYGYALPVDENPAVKAATVIFLMLFSFLDQRDGSPAGICWVIQWIFPPPSNMSLAGICITFRSGQSLSMIFFASRSLASFSPLNAGSMTAPFEK